MRVEFEGQTHEFPDDASEAEIQAMLGGGAPAAAPEAPSGFMGQLARMEGLGARAGYKGAATAALSPASLLADAGINAAYYGKKALAKTGLVSEPDVANYGGAGNVLPTTSGISKAVDKGLTAVGLPEPTTALEKGVSAVGEAAVGSLTGSGVGAFVGGKIGRFLAAEPVIGAAASGTGAAVASGAEALGKDNLPGWAAPAAGMAAGVGVGTALSAGRAFTGYVPGFGRVGSNTPKAIDATANQVVQGMASDPRTAARNIRGASELETAEDFAAPGYRFLSTEAAQDTGLASSKQAIRDFSGGAVADLEQGNNTALTRAFEREGAAEGAANVPREQARAGSNRDLGAFGLTGATAARNEPVEVTPFIQSMERQSAGSTPGSSGASRGVNSESAGLLRNVAERREIPQFGPDGAAIAPRIEYWATPERLQSFRTDLSQSLGAAPAGAALPIPSAALERRTTGAIMGRADDMISDSVGTVPGPAGRDLDYPAYMARQRGLRQESDERSFMRAQMEKVAPNTNPITGAQEFQTPKMARMMNEGQRASTVPGSQNSRMTINSLSPARQNFLQRVEDLGQLANFSNSKGLASAGASTAKRNTSDVRITDTLTSAQAPYERALALASRVPGIGLAGRFAGKVFDASRKEAAVTNVQKVQNRIGQFETDRGAALSMLEGATLPARGVKISAKRQAGRTARYGGQSFLAAQSAAMDERRGRRP